MDLEEIGYEVEDWIQLDQDRDNWQDVINTVMKLLLP
jgi:hypothetical protein